MSGQLYHTRRLPVEYDQAGLKLTYCTRLNSNLRKCKVLVIMIRSFKHKGLEKFFISGSTAGIQTAHKTRIEERLQALHTAFSIEDMNIPGWRLHPLKGDKKGLWAVNVSGNWRIVFEFADGDAYVVNYEDYH